MVTAVELVVYGRWTSGEAFEKNERMSGLAADQPVEPPTDPPRRSLGRNILAILSSQVATWSLSAVLLVVMPRYLGPVALGQLRISTSMWAVVTVIAVFGTSSFMSIEIAKRHQQARPLSGSVTRLRASVFASTLPGVALFVTLAGYESRLVLIVAIGAVGALAGSISGTQRSALLACEQMGVTGGIDVAAEVLTVVTVVFALVVGAGVVTIACVTAATMVVAAALFRRGLLRTTPPTDEPPLFRGWTLMRRGSPFFFADAMVTIYLQVDTLVISLIASEREIGWYATADSIFGSLLFVPAVLLTAIFPRVARLHHEKPEDVPPLLLQAFSTMLLVGVWIGLGTVVVSRSFTQTLFGPAFSGSGPVLAIFGLVTILGHQTIVLASFAIASGKAKLVGTMLLVSTIASIPLDLVLVRWTRNSYGNGAIGAGLAYIVTEGIQIVMSIAFITPSIVCRATGLRAARCIVAGGAMLAVGWPLRNRSFLLSGAAASLMYFVAHVVLRTADDFERETLKRSLAGIRRRLPTR